jgi:hypothetical protein
MVKAPNLLGRVCPIFAATLTLLLQGNYQVVMAMLASQTVVALAATATCAARCYGVPAG